MEFTICVSLTILLYPERLFTCKVRGCAERAEMGVMRFASWFYKVLFALVQY